MDPLLCPICCAHHFPGGFEVSWGHLVAFRGCVTPGCDPRGSWTDSWSPHLLNNSGFFLSFLPFIWEHEVRLSEKGILNCSCVGLELWHSGGDGRGLGAAGGSGSQTSEILWGGNRHTQGPTSCWAPDSREGVPCRYKTPSGRAEPQAGPQGTPGEAEEGEDAQLRLTHPGAISHPLHGGRAGPLR